MNRFIYGHSFTHYKMKSEEAKHILLTDGRKCVWEERGELLYGDPSYCTSNRREKVKKEIDGSMEVVDREFVEFERRMEGFEYDMDKLSLELDRAFGKPKRLEISSRWFICKYRLEGTLYHPIEASGKQGAIKEVYGHLETEFGLSPRDQAREAEVTCREATEEEIRKEKEWEKRIGWSKNE